jgi:hypothetical protein
VAFVQACIAQDRLKPAAKAVRTLGLQEEFPDVEVGLGDHVVCDYDVKKVVESEMGLGDGA